MNTLRTVCSPIDGKRVPVTIILNIQPLLCNGKQIVRPDGRVVMDDEWIYRVMPYYGNMSINVNRAAYCQKIYLQNIKIADSIGAAKLSPRLQKFIDTVADTLVFSFNGKSFQIFLKKTAKGYDIDSVKFYWSTVATGGIMPSWMATEKVYPGTTGWRYKGVDLKEMFGFDEN